MSSGGDGDRHREHLGVSHAKQAKSKKSVRRPIDPEDILGSISSAPERISHDTHLFAVSFSAADPQQYYPNYRQPALPPRRYEDLPLQAIRRPRSLSVGRISDGTPSPTDTSPQLSSMKIGDSSSEQSDVMAGTPPLTQCFVHPCVSPSSTATPSATPADEMSALAPVQKERLGRVMIEPDGSLWHPAKDAARALKDSVRKLYTQAYHSWSEIPNSIRHPMFNEFKQDPKTKQLIDQELMDSIKEKIVDYKTIRPKNIIEDNSVRHIARRISFQEGDKEQMIQDYLEEVRKNLLQTIT
ncbi:hypothetical protein R3W88_016262 [Solanum pinnatisectum]|uniref:Uncharacterized protein n=1 Tax=Solanum pinnatisectum TaxID=50273 RepID=A0AAV9KX34_9SOLN|nr:hypothetical protein R3W88_016262 [Solanum pinnatisectum]